MVTQGVKAIAITPTSPNVQDALQKAVDAGIKVVLVDNDIPDWDGKSSVVATDNLAGGKLAGEFMKEPAEGRRARSPSSQGVAGAPSLDDRVDGLQGGPGRRLQDRRQAADRLRPDQGPQRGAGHADRQSRRHAPSTAPAARRSSAPSRRSKAPARSQALIIVGFDAAPGRGHGDRRRHRAGVGRPVPGEDGLDGRRDRARRSERRGRSTRTSTPAPRW